MIFIGNSTWSWCYALWSSLAFPHDLDATLYDLHWQFHMILMLRSMIFIGISTWSWCYAPWSSLAIPHDLDATLYDLQLPLHTSASDSLGWGGVGGGGMITSFPRLGSILAYGLCVTETLYISRWHIHADMNTLTIFSFRLLDPPEWACRRVCNVE